MFVALFVGAVLLVSNFGYGWYTDKVTVQTQYKAFTTEEIRADVGLHIGLRGVNITLKGLSNEWRDTRMVNGYTVGLIDKMDIHFGIF